MPFQRILKPRRKAYSAIALSVLTIFFLGARSAEGHAILVEAVPGIRSTVKGPDLAVRLRFNVRIEAARSRLSLLLPDNSARKLEIQKQPSMDSLTAQAAGLKPGAYRLRWQVLAPDGHITRGEFPFTVAAS